MVSVGASNQIRWARYSLYFFKGFFGWSAQSALPSSPRSSRAIGGGGGGGWARMQDWLKRAALGSRLFPLRHLFRPPRPNLLRRPVQPLVRRRHRRRRPSLLLPPARCSREPRCGRATAPCGAVLTFCEIGSASDGGKVVGISALPDDFEVDKREVSISHAGASTVADHRDAFCDALFERRASSKS